MYQSLRGASDYHSKFKEEIIVILKDITLSIFSVCPQTCLILGKNCPNSMGSAREGSL